MLSMTPERKQGKLKERKRNELKLKEAKEKLEGNVEKSTKKEYIFMAKDETWLSFNKECLGATR